MDNTITLPVSEVTKKLHLTIRLTGMVVWRIRVALGCYIMLCGAKVIGCGVEIEEDSK